MSQLRRQNVEIATKNCRNFDIMYYWIMCQNENQNYSISVVYLGITREPEFIEKMEVVYHQRVEET